MDCFDTELCDALISAMQMNLEIYILGDLHCNLLNSSKLSISFEHSLMIFHSKIFFIQNRGKRKSIAR